MCDEQQHLYTILMDVLKVEHKIYTSKLHCNLVTQNSINCELLSPLKWFSDSQKVLPASLYMLFCGTLPYIRFRCLTLSSSSVISPLRLLLKEHYSKNAGALQMSTSKTVKNTKNLRNIFQRNKTEN